MKLMRWGLGALGLAVAGAVVVGALGLGVGASAQEPKPADGQNRPVRDAMKQKLEERRPGMFKAVRGAFGAAAEVIGIDVETLRTELQAGKSLAQIGEAHGVSRDALKTGIVNKINNQLAQAVVDGKITEAQKTEMLTRVNEHIDQMLDGTKDTLKENVKERVGDRIERRRGGMQQTP